MTEQEYNSASIKAETFIREQLSKAVEFSMETDFKHGSPVVYTGSIPVCPFCKAPTNRTGGSGYTTSMYFPPIYDDQGNNINPDRNTVSKDWRCFSCERVYMISGNKIDGFVYAYNQ